jgi:hypothetical protein
MKGSPGRKERRKLEHQAKGYGKTIPEIVNLRQHCGSSMVRCNTVV